MNAISDLARASVLVVGDVMLDEYLWGEVQRISPEAPVPVVEMRRRTHIPGGAANVAAGLVALGARARVIGVVGDDAAAVVLRDAIGSAGVEDAELVEDASRLTTSKTRVIAHAQQVVRIDAETREVVPHAVESAVVARAVAGLDSADVAVLSDYRKGVVSPAVAQAVINAATDAAKPVVVDPKGFDYSRYRGATVITPNEHDAARTANLHIEAPEDLVMVADRLADACDGASLLITRGAAGMSLFSGGKRFDVRARARDVYDVTGAGDTVVAVLAAALAAGSTLREAVVVANEAAGIVVGKVGTSTVTLEELEERLAG